MNGLAASQAPPPYNPGLGARTRREFDVTRTAEAGGDLASQVLPKAVTPFELMWRALPEEGMFSPLVSPSNPFAFELGAYTVPSRMTLLVFGLRPDIYRFSGVDPGDFVPVEERRLGSIMGFELLVDKQHPGNIDFQIDPVPIQRTSQQAFPTTQANAGQFARANAGAAANASGSSNMILPQRPDRYGPPAPIPFTLYVESGQTVQARCLIFRPVPIPLAFIEFDLTGILVPSTFSDNLQEAYKFPQNAGEESMR